MGQRHHTLSITPTASFGFGNYKELASDIANLSKFESQSKFAESYAAVLQSTLQSTESLGQQLASIKLAAGDKNFGKTSLDKQLADVAKVMQLEKATLQTERSVFYTTLGGFDTHAAYDISDKMKVINDALESFKKEKEAQNTWNEVTVVAVSDFGRTLTGNGQGCVRNMHA